MKVRDFLNSLEDRDQILNKIKSFKDQKRRETFLAQHRDCGSCGNPLKFTHASYYMQNVIHEKACCSACGQTIPERKYALN